MANSDKNILITPNVGLSSQPNIQFTGFGNTTLTLVVNDSSFSNISFKDGTKEILTVDRNLNSTVQLAVGSSDGSLQKPILEVLQDGSTTLNAKSEISFSNGGLVIPTADTNSISKNMSGALVYDKILGVPKFNDGVRWYNMCRPKRITEGCVLCLDAAEAISSNVGLSTNWTDISGYAKHGQLFNGPLWTGQYGGIFTFDGIDDYVQLSSFFNYPQFTISLFVAAGRNSQTAYADIFDNNHTGTRNFVCQQDNVTNNSYGFGAIGASSASNVSFSLVEEEWTHLVFTFDNVRTRLFRNGLWSSTGGDSSAVNYSAQTLRIAGWQSGGRHWRGKMGNFICYNRVLSESEIYYLFSLDRERFGI